MASTLPVFSGDNDSCLSWVGGGLVREISVAQSESLTNEMGLDFWLGPFVEEAKSIMFFATSIRSKNSLLHFHLSLFDG